MTKLVQQQISFTEDLAVLLRSGADLDSALAVLADTQSSSELPLSELRASVRQGLTLSDALSGHADLFDNYFLGMVRSGEATGKLAAALEQLSAQLEIVEELKHKVSSALVYPLILSVAMVLSLSLVLGVILPKLTALFETFGGELSATASVLLSIGQFFDQWGEFIAIAFFVLVLLAYLLQDPLRLKARGKELFARLPFVGRLLNQIDFARFTSTLSSLLGSGVSQIEALEIASESYQDIEKRAQIKDVVAQVEQGVSLATALEASSDFAGLYTHSIESGERAGRLSETLEVLARRLEKDFSRRAERLASILEPILIVSLGLVIGVIIYTVFAALQSMGDLPL